MFLKKGDNKIVNILLKLNADIDMKENEYGYTALMESSSKVYIKIVNILLEYNADTSIEDIYGFTAIGLCFRIRKF
ncbi:ankyrin repeat domain-containing protein [Brachyspira hyodysenteriae]|uniref:ankyrin repeat domain-containing protein n=1 Tax=Brachyspira hyodysenteriae TaxID=159 RepID=UPI002B25F247|nr:ankyrin repeat domain-containing protein [Brachyspira hyodysenteriae]WPC37526.1 ankyrin repeat domain-containing protein [Brachyspira hyodysenteriae]